MKIILKDLTELTVTAVREEFTPSFIDDPEVYADIVISNDTEHTLEDIINIFSTDNITSITVVNDLGVPHILSQYKRIRTLRHEYLPSGREILVRLLK